MRKVSVSPIVNTLVLVNVIVGCVVLASMLLPLPSLDGRVDSENQLVEGTGLDSGSTVDTNTVLARPLFHTSRRPPTPKVSTPEPSAPAPRIEAPYTLVGIMGTSGDDRTAYLQNTLTGETISVRTGQEAGDWQVDTVGQNFVTLVFGNERRVIELAGGG